MMINMSRKTKSKSSDKSETEVKAIQNYRVDTTATKEPTIDPNCQGILPDHCEELKLRSFSNNPESLFLEVKLLEDRYDFSISEFDKKFKYKVNNSQIENGDKYRIALEKKKTELEIEIEDLKSEINKSINFLNLQETSILTKIEEIYNKHEKNLLDKAFLMLGFDF
jgi:hypothetical protein